jgi:hypothetical protein
MRLVIGLLSPLRSGYFFYYFLGWNWGFAPQTAVTFFSGRKETNERKLPWERGIA